MQHDTIEQASTFVGNRPQVSIVIPTYNGERYLHEVLDAIFHQDVDFAFEVIVIDSGSRDRTCDIARSFPARLIEIPNSEFNHGETRNRGAREARGEYVVLLTQDATPASAHWLSSMISAFSAAENVGNVVGKHIPRPGCNPTIQKDIIQTFTAIGSDRDALTVYRIREGEEGRREYEAKRDRMRFNSDANAAYRKAAWEKVPFRRVSYCEDQLIGQDMLEAGFTRVYCPDAAVYHSHSYPVGQFLKRYFDEYRGLNVALGYVDKVNLLTLLPSTFLGLWHDAKYIWSCDEYTILKKGKWIFHSAAMNFFRRVGAYFGGRHDRLPKFMTRIFSLEGKA